MSKFSFILKSCSLGLLIILVVFALCFFLVGKYSNAHPHGMTGLITILLGLVTAGLFLVTIIVLAFLGKTNLRNALITATVLSFMVAAFALLIEM